MRRVVVPSVLIAVCCAACTAVTPPPSDVDVDTTPVTVSGSIAIPPPPSVPPPTSTIAAPPSEVPPPPGHPSPEPGLFTDPVTVAVEWMRQWCAFDWQEPRNANLDRAAAFQTSSGAQEDRRRGDDAHTYEQVRAQQVSGRCDQVSAAPSPEAPSSPDTVFLVVSARRVNLAAGEPFESEAVSTVRRVVRQADGRWLVGGPQEAG